MQRNQAVTHDSVTKQPKRINKDPLTNCASVLAAESN